MAGAGGTGRIPPSGQKLHEVNDQESLRWQAVVISLQTLLGYPFTVGAVSQ
jgi:hypothetical protein